MSITCYAPILIAFSLAISIGVSCYPQTTKPLATDVKFEDRFIKSSDKDITEYLVFSKEDYAVKLSIEKQDLRFTIAELEYKLDEAKKELIRLENIYNIVSPSVAVAVLSK